MPRFLGADGWRDVLGPVVARHTKPDIIWFSWVDAVNPIAVIRAEPEGAGYFHGYC